MIRLTIWTDTTAPHHLGDDELLSGSWARLDGFFRETTIQRPWWWHVETFNSGHCVTARTHPVTWQREWASRSGWIREIQRQWGHRCLWATRLPHVSPVHPRKTPEMNPFGW